MARAITNRQSSAGAIGRAWPPGAILCVAVAAWAAYGGYVSLDPMFSLLWGREIAGGDLPDFSAGPTPHPLSNAVGAVLAPLGAAAEPALLALGYLSLGGLAYATWTVTRHLAGALAGGVAVALLLTRDLVAATTALAYLDIPFTALVVAAVAVGLRRPHSAWAILGLLAVAGLLRPEAWLLSALYWLWLVPRQPRTASVLTAALVAAAPLLWAATDLAATGNALHSLEGTRDAAQRVAPYGHGLAAVLGDAPRVIAQGAGVEVAVCAAGGLVLLLWRRRRAGLAVTAVLGGLAVATFVPVVAGTLLNPRYTIPLVAMLCCLAGVAVGGWTGERARRGTWEAVAAAGAVLLAAVTVLDQAGRLLDMRREIRDTARSRDAVRSLVDGGLPCTPLVVPNGRLTPFAAIWADLERAEIVDASAAGEPAGTYVHGTPAALEGIVVLPRRDGAARPPEPPARARAVRSAGGWTLYDAC